MCAHLRLNDLGVLEMGRCRGTRGELRRELAETEVLALRLDQPKRGGVPKARRPAVAQHDFIAVGKGEELAEPSTYPPYLRLHSLLAMARAEVGGRDLGQRSDLFRPDLGWPRTEASVAG